MFILVLCLCWFLSAGWSEPPAWQCSACSGSVLAARELHQCGLRVTAMGCSLRAEGRAFSCNLVWICYWLLSVFPSLVFCLPVSCLHYPWIPLHDIQDTPVTELACFVLLLSAHQGGQNGESLGACVEWCTNVLAAAERGTKLAFLSVSLFLQRPGMPSGARMPHQGAPMGPPGPPYVGSPSVRPGMPQTVMETTRKRTAPQQVQQQQVQQQVQQQQQATQNRARRWVFWKDNTGGQFEEAKMVPV